MAWDSRHNDAIDEFGLCDEADHAHLAAATAGSDYAATTGTLTFAPGVVSQPILVPVVNDSLYEGDETFVLSLSGPTNATVADPTGTGTILNDDPLPTLAIGNASAKEGNSGTVATCPSP